MNDRERQEGFAKLREKFPPSAIGKIPKGGTQLDYVGHAPTTDRLLSVDPEWTWEPVSLDAQGMPALVISKDGWPIGMWIKLTVLGVTRLGYGSVAPGKSEAIKELIGDAIRNAAMRFGVALDLWAKEELESNLSGADVETAGASPPAASPESVGADATGGEVGGGTTQQATLGGEAGPAPVVPSEEAYSLAKVITTAVDNQRVAPEKVVRKATLLLQRNEQPIPERGIDGSTLPELGTVILKALIRELELEEKASA